MLKQYQFKNYNFMIVLNAAVLWSLGTVFINAAKPSYLPKQLMGLGLGFFIIAVMSFIDYNFILRFVWALYGVNILLSVLVAIIGKDVNGARRWFDLRSFGTFQPSELTKIIMIIYAAYFIERHQEDLNEPKTLLKLAVSCAIPIGLILVLQPDLSTSLDICIILAAMIFVGGISYKIIGIALAIILPLAVGFILYAQLPNPLFIPDYWQTRINTFLHPEQYVSSSALQQNNSVMAIGSGQLFGKGLHSDSLATVKDANLISEQQTDFIFSVVGEMWGFVGSIIVIALLMLLVVQCLLVAKKAKNTAGMLIATGMAALIGFQSFINIGVATKLLPNTGLPLPFISYGLSSLVSISIGMGLVLNIGLQKRKY